jgi:TolB-like protein/Tfp pilus assembly protein PilF/DNA-binding winged helix-turn-helix (wHTH) protein
MAVRLHAKYVLGEFELDADKYLLTHHNSSLHLAELPFRVLLYLVENRERYVSRQELLERFWQSSDAYEETLTKCISTIRTQLNDAANAPRYIETRKKVGYRYVGPFESSPAEPILTEAPAVELEQIRAISISIVEDDKHQKQRPTTEAMQTRAATNSKLRMPARLRALLLAIILLGVAVAASILVFSKRLTEPETGAEVRTLAVLPFKTIGAQTDDEYLALGLADDLIARLNDTGKVVVRPTSSVRKYADPNKDPLEAGRELGVEAVLDGSIRRAGERIRVTVQLVRVRDGKQLWADRFDENFNDILAVQDLASGRLVKALVPKLSTRVTGITKHYTDDSDAFQAYLKGFYHTGTPTRENIQTAIGYFQQAIEKDPNYALAYVGLAECYIDLSAPPLGVLTPKEAAQKAKATAMKALEIDPDSSEARIALARVNRNEWDWPGVEREFKRALDLNPNDLTVHASYGSFLSQLGRHDECIAEMRRALVLDPLDPRVNVDFGYRLYIARRYDEAITQFQKCIGMDPQSWEAHSGLAWVYEQLGRYDDALAQYRIGNSLHPEILELTWGSGRVNAARGRKNAAEGVIAQLKELSKKRYVSGYFPALIYARLGDKDRAFEWLEEAYDSQDLWMRWLKVDPAFDAIRSDPRFASLLRRLGLGS